MSPASLKTQERGRQGRWGFTSLSNMPMVLGPPRLTAAHDIRRRNLGKRSTPIAGAT